MRKRIITTVLALVMGFGGAVGGTTIPVASDTVVYEVLLNAETTGLKAFQQDNQTYIEARRSLETFGWVVFWSAKTQQLAANSCEGSMLIHTASTAELTLDGSALSFDCASVIVDGTMFLPLQMLTRLTGSRCVASDDGTNRLLLFKTFDGVDSHVKRVLQQASAAANYNPLNFIEYIKYAKENPDLPIDKVLLYINIGVHIPPYSNIRPVENPHDVFAVVDKNHRFDDDFKPELVNVDGFYWAPDAGDAWLTMKAAARADGIKLGLNNTYRSISEQSYNYNRKIKSGRSVKSVDAYNSRPGHSEHHTGYAADMAGLGTFVGSAAHTWVIENGYKFGFIISFQAGKEFINNYSPEGWHIRWFPLWAAKIMHDENLTIQEFDNLYLNPGSHGFVAEVAAENIIAETGYVVKPNLSFAPGDIGKAPDLTAGRDGLGDTD